MTAFTNLSVAVTLALALLGCVATTARPEPQPASMASQCTAVDALSVGECEQRARPVVLKRPQPGGVALSAGSVIAFDGARFWIGYRNTDGDLMLLPFGTTTNTPATNDRDAMK